MSTQMYYRDKQAQADRGGGSISLAAEAEMSSQGMSGMAKKNYIAIMRSKLEKQMEAKKQALINDRQEGKQEAEEARYEAMRMKKEERMRREPIESPWYP